MATEEIPLRVISRRESRENLPGTSSCPTSFAASLERSPAPNLDAIETCLDPEPGPSTSTHRESCSQASHQRPPCPHREPLLDPRPGSPTSNLQVYNYRFIILIIYSIYSGVNLYQLNRFTIIETVMQKFFETTPFTVAIGQLLFLIVLVVLLLIVIRIVDRFNMRATGIICAICTFLGASLRLVATDPEEKDLKYILMAQTLCGFAQIFSIVVPVRVVSIWFPAEELHRACAVALSGGEIGILFSLLYPLKFAGNMKDDMGLQQEVYQILLYNFAFCLIAFLLVILFLRAKPPTVPSAQRNYLMEIKPSYLTDFLDLFFNHDFVTILIIYGLACGLWIVFVINREIIYTYYFPESLVDLTSITIITTIVGGVIGNYLSGWVLDKTLEYRALTKVVFYSMTFSYVAVAVFLHFRWHWSSYITIILFGFFSSTCLNIAHQFIAEVTFPITEVLPIAIFQLCIFAVTICYQVVFSTLIEFQQIKAIHGIIGITLSGITAGAYCLTLNLKRMVFKARQE